MAGKIVSRVMTLSDGRVKMTLRVLMLLTFRRLRRNFASSVGLIIVESSTTVKGSSFSMTCPTVIPRRDFFTCAMRILLLLIMIESTFAIFRVSCGIRKSFRLRKNFHIFNCTMRQVPRQKSVHPDNQPKAARNV